YKVHPIIKQILNECKIITEKYASLNNLQAPQLLSYNDLAKEVSQVFIALHGRPGEDGSVQEKLEQVGLSYNGSDRSSSEITIDKYRTNEILMENGFLVAKHMLISSADWKTKKEELKNKLQSEYKYPFIAKPVDDGCSSAVKKI